MKLSKIEVTFERTKQVQQYEPAKASVTIGYVAEEDEVAIRTEHEVGELLEAAKRKVYAVLGLKYESTFTREPVLAEALGLKTPGERIIQGAKEALEIAKVTQGLAAPHSPQSASGTVEAVKTEVNPTQGAAPTGANVTPIANSPGVTEPKKRGRPKGSTNKVDPAAMEDGPNTTVEAVTGLVDPAAMIDEAQDNGCPNDPDPITYTAADLARAISNRVIKMVQAKIASPSDKIKAYIETWRPVGVIGPVSAIYQHVPEDKRAEFLAKLEEVA